MKTPFLWIITLYFSCISILSNAQHKSDFKTLEKLYKEALYIEALTMLDSIISTSPNDINAETYVLLGKTAAALGDCNRAITAWNMYYKLAPYDSWKVDNLKAACYAKLGLHEEALDAYSRYLVHDPQHGPSYMGRGQEYYLNSKYARAIQDYTTIIDRKLKGLNTSEVYYERGLAYAKFGMNENALKDMESCLKLAPGNALAFFQKGLILLEQHKQALACEALQQSAVLGYLEAKEYYSQICSHLSKP